MSKGLIHLFPHPDDKVRMRRRAVELGFGLGEYLRHLVSKDLAEAEAKGEFVDPIKERKD